MLKLRGYLYESKHEGWYSVSDETFYPSTAVRSALDPSTGRKITVKLFCQRLYEEEAEAWVDFY
jgi:methionyl-tRNA synthetase